MESDDQLLSPPPTVDELRSRSTNGKKRRKLSISSSPEPELARIDDDAATNGRSRSLDRSPHGAAAASSSDGNLSGSRDAAAEQNGRATTGMERCVKIPSPQAKPQAKKKGMFRPPQINGCLNTGSCRQRYRPQASPLPRHPRRAHRQDHARALADPEHAGLRGRTAALCFADPLLLAPVCNTLPSNSPHRTPCQWTRAKLRAGASGKHTVRPIAVVLTVHIARPHRTSVEQLSH